MICLQPILKIYTQIISTTCVSELNICSKNAHLNSDVKNGAIHIPIKKNGSVIYSFLGKRGLIVYLAALKKGAMMRTEFGCITS